jgi:hypothetical protein
MLLHNTDIEEISWANIRNNVYQANPLLANFIDQVATPSSPNLFLARYPFGAYVFEKNQIQFPTSKKISHPLSDSTLPLGLLMNKKLEVFIETNGRVLSSNLITAGEMIGLWEFLDTPKRTISRCHYQITAGVRTTFFLSQIANELAHRKLKKLYRLKSSVPKNLLDHWRVFREISHSDFIASDWYCEVLFFSKRFIQEICQHKNYSALKNHLTTMLCEQTKILRERSYIDTNWDALLMTMEMQSFKTLPHEMHIIRNLLQVGSGLAAGFRPAVDEEGLPLKLLQKIYIHDYGLKEYAPILMEPYYLMNLSSAKKPVYYSLPFASQFYSKMLLSSKHSTLHALEEIMYINQALRQWILNNGNLDFPKLDQLHYEYFYSEAHNQHGIRSTAEILEFDDPLAMQMSQCANRKFPDKSVFLRGSILISGK